MAETLSAVEGLIVGKLDHTVNEVVGLEIEGFPTLMFYAANNKNPLIYKDERDPELMIDWL